MNMQVVLLGFFVEGRMTNTNLVDACARNKSES